jgi:hypothetical protein
VARPKTWTDDQLRAAISVAETWNDVVKAIGRQPSSRATATVQGHALRIGGDVRHLPPIPQGVAVLPQGRAFSSDQLAEAVQCSRSWADVMRKLGYSKFSGSRYATAKRMATTAGLDTSHLPPSWNERPLEAADPLPFSAQAEDRNLRAAAIGEVAAWFLRRGYVPSIPMEPTRYDLVVESDDGLKRVQVKTTTRRTKGGSGLYYVTIGRMAYEPEAAINGNGRRARLHYGSDEIDLFFVITGSGDKYLIPLAVTGELQSIVLDRKYAAYRVD